MTIGVFDGVHIGHQAVLTHVVDRARSMGVAAVAMTFDPHPIKLLRPGVAPRLLTTLEQRLALIAQTGIETSLVVPFTHRLARMSAADFVRDVLVDRLAVREVYIGDNFRFGADRGGDVELLTSMGAELGFEAAAAPIVEAEGSVVSSTRVRQAVADGRVEEVVALLGRSVFLDGAVLEGKRLGRTLGFPTLNIEVENELSPSNGVYITAVHIPSFARTFPAVTNIGVRPTFNGGHRVVEAHILGNVGNLYGTHIRIQFVERIRDEVAFRTAAELVERMKEDVEETLRILREHRRSLVEQEER